MEDKELRELERLLEDWEDDDEYVLFQYHEVGKEGSPYRMIPHQVTVDTLTKALAQAREETLDEMIKTLEPFGGWYGGAIGLIRKLKEELGL